MPKSTFLNLSEEKRQRIIDSSYAPFIEKPYEDVAILDITTRAQIPVGSFYRYFYDKDDLYLYLFGQVEYKIKKIQEEHQQEENQQSILFKDTNIDFSIYLTKQELLFDKTWIKVPSSVMQKFYFGEYDDSLVEQFRNNFNKLYSDGTLSQSADPELALYLFVTSTFNLYMYCRKKNITEIDEIIRLKKAFFSEFFPYGFINSNSDNNKK
ncbi:MAG: TetR/AcrR family transcriptional regulator [Oscillospiraceae bacterium]